MDDPKFAEHLSVFVDVVREGSFSGAGRRRSVTPSSIGRQIDALELILGVPVFVRSTRALTVTDAGQRLFERARKLLDDMADARSEVSAMGGAISGVLRIACFPTFGKRYVIPALQSLMEKYPALKVDLDLTERLADPVQERLDAVIRIGQLSDSGLIATKLAAQTRLLVASPKYLQRAGTPMTVAELGSHRLLDKLHGADLLGWADVLGGVAGGSEHGSIVFRCDDFEALRLAALADGGLAFLPSWVIGPDVIEGSLTRLPVSSEGWNSRDSGIYLLRALPQASPKLEAFTAALRGHIGSPPVWEPQAIS